MKRILALILALMMILCVFASCAKGGEEDNSVENQTENKIENKIENEETTETNEQVEKGCTHKDTDKNHLCDKCKEKLNDCADEDKNHTCDICKEIVHDYKESTCTICGLYKDGKKVILGSYPQTEVKDSALIATLDSKVGVLPTIENAQNWTSYGYYMNGEKSDYMWYIDLDEGEEKYRGVYFTSFRSIYSSDYSNDSSYQKDNGYSVNTVYWFKYEPVSWTIINENSEKGTALILCDMIVDSQSFDELSEYSNNYTESTIRKWLNETFYNTVFNDLQKQIIKITEVDHGVKTTGYDKNQYAGKKTEDKLFLLSYEEAINDKYGFLKEATECDTARQKKITNYAQVQGAYVCSEEHYAGNGYWWLRSPNNEFGYYARQVSPDGYVDYNHYVADTYCGVVPALQIKL